MAVSKTSDLGSQKKVYEIGVGLKRVKKSFTGIGPVKFINIGSQNLFKVLLPIGKKQESTSDTSGLF